jgi:hypothetical protein
MANGPQNLILRYQICPVLNVRGCKISRFLVKVGLTNLTTK